VTIWNIIETIKSLGDVGNGRQNQILKVVLQRKNLDLFRWGNSLLRKYLREENNRLVFSETY
jgi:hypothetical protein